MKRHRHSICSSHRKEGAVCLVAGGSSVSGADGDQSMCNKFFEEILLGNKQPRGAFSAAVLVAVGNAGADKIPLRAFNYVLSAFARPKITRWAHIFFARMVRPNPEITEAGQLDS